jgi:hypothetical protein
MKKNSRKKLDYNFYNKLSLYNACIREKLETDLENLIKKHVVIKG